jgi:hypothetical protein
LLQATKDNGRFCKIISALFELDRSILIGAERFPAAALPVERIRLIKNTERSCAYVLLLFLGWSVGVPDVAVDLPRFAGAFPDDNVFAFLDEVTVGPLERVCANFVDEVAGGGGFEGSEFSFDPGFEKRFPKILNGGASFDDGSFKRENHGIFGVKRGGGGSVTFAGVFRKSVGKPLDFGFEIRVSGAHSGGRKKEEGER